MRMKAVAILITALLIIVVTSRFISAIDAPHEPHDGTNICGSCHAEGLLGTINSPFWGGTYTPANIDDTVYNKLCLNCHRVPFGPYNEINAPLVKPHSSLNTDSRYGDWTRECVNCHDPHYQRQKNYKTTDASNLYLASGTITLCDAYNSGNNTTTLHYSSITYKSGNMWNATKLANKTGDYRRTILFPNVGKLGYNYPVTGVDETAKTITVSGDATGYLSPPTTFAAIYGQYIKDYIDASVVLGTVNINIGDGADGAITINTVKNINTDMIAGGRSYPDGVNWQITNNVLSGQTTISSGTVIPYGFAVGDEIMIINLKGTSTNYTNVGLYELKTITALPSSTSMTIDSNLTHSYDGTTQKIMVQRVPNYTNVTINTGGSLTCNAFDGNKGGVVVFRATGTVTVNATDGITVSSKGFRGGAGGGNGGDGETYNGTGTIGGGGGGGSNTSLYIYCYGFSNAVGGAGGNGGYGSAGSGSSHGSSYGVTDLTSKLFLGSGGGGGGGASLSCFDDGSASAAGGNGGSAGGIIYVSANTFTVNSGSAVSSSGSNGTSGTTNIGPHAHAYGGNGGSGAGGSIAVYAGQINDSGSISANGGSGAGGGRTYAAYLSFNGSNPAPNYSSSPGRVITPGSAPFTVQVKFFDQTGTNSYADGHSMYTLADGYPAYNGICELCHGQTNHFRGKTDGSAPDQNHTNLSFFGSGSIPGSNCTACHSHDGGFKPKGGCLCCHSMAINGRANISSQFSGNSHHIQGVEVTGVQCYQCHWEANADGSINVTYHEGNNPVTGGGVSGAKVDLVIWTVTRPTTYTAGTTAVQYTANGTRSEIRKLNSHCLGCHNAQNNAAIPFGDGKTPKQYAWDGRSIDERYSQTGTTPWGKYSGGNVTPKNTQTKAYSAHGNAVNNQGGWDLNEAGETWTSTRNGTENVICFDCHNSHGSSVSGTTTSYTSATTNGGILKDTIAGKGGYSITYKPQAGGSTANKNAYNAGTGLCFDCHMTAASGTTLWGYNSTFGAAQDIRGYWDTPYFGPGTAPTQQRFAYRSPMSQKGGHLGASSALSSPATHTINGLCTPCHDPHGVSPTLGSNMQYGVPLLKGTWLASPYKEDRAPQYDVVATLRTDYSKEGLHYYIDQNTFGSDIKSSVTGITQTDTQFAGLCLNCHQKSSLTNGTNHTWKSKDRIHESVKGWKTADATIEHNYPCSKCHTPHNSGLPRLMITNCLDSRHKGFQTNNTAPHLSGSGTYLSGTYYGPGAIKVWCGTRDEDGHGAGRWPGSWYALCAPIHLYDQTVTCHENYDSNQYWNIKTPWSQSGTVNSITTPSLIHEANIIGTAPQSVTLEWNAVTCSNDDPVQYYVYVDNASDFSSPDYTSGWISETSCLISSAVNLSTDGLFLSGFDSSGNLIGLRWNVSTSKEEFGVINTTTGSFSVRGTVGDLAEWSGSSVISGVTLYVIGVNSSDQNKLYILNTTTGALTSTVNLSTDGLFLSGFDSSGNLIGLRWNVSTSKEEFGVINTNGSFSVMGTVGDMTGWSGSSVISGVTLYVIGVNSSDQPKLYIRNITTGSLSSANLSADGLTLSGFDSGGNLIGIRWNVSTSKFEFGLIKTTNGSFSVRGTVGDLAGWSGSSVISGNTLHVSGVNSADQPKLYIFNSTYCWTVSIQTSGTWYWRVQARDANQTNLLSLWSFSDSFGIRRAPPAPTLIDDFSSRTVKWNPVTDPDGDPVQYYVQVDDDPNLGSPNYTSGWISGTSWTPPFVPGHLWYWRVQARDANYPFAVSPWSTVHFFSTN